MNYRTNNKKGGDKEMNLKKQIMGIFKKKQEIKTEQKELTERIEKALYDTVGEKGFTPQLLTIHHIDYSQEEIQIFLEPHYKDGTKLCDILRFIDELNVPYENVWFGLYKCEVTSFEGNLFLLIKLTDKETRK